MRQVHQHWDPLREVVLGACYEPGFFHWIKHAQVREHFETLALETEQDFQNLKITLERFGVRVHRPSVYGEIEDICIGGKYVPPPVAPRDYFTMIGQDLWVCDRPNRAYAKKIFGPSTAPGSQQLWALDQQHHQRKLAFYQDIFSMLESQGTAVKTTHLDYISGCFVSRIGQDLFFATQSPDDDKNQILQEVQALFPDYRSHVVDAAGHGDSTYCAVCPGLIISLRDIPTYQNTFPGWEVVYLPPSDYDRTARFRQSMKANRGRWFLPGFDLESSSVDLVEHYFGHWVGQASETVFDVNILVVDHSNIIVSSHSDQVQKACERYGITVHVCAFRHRYFWDAGIHCITNDLDRTGIRQSFIEKKAAID